MKILSALLCILLCFSGLVFAVEKLSTKIEAVPKVFQVTPIQAANLSPGMYPLFQNYRGTKACGITLAGLSGVSKDDPESGPVLVPGMELVVPVDEGYRQNGSLLITWTLRVEGVAPKALKIRHGLCNRFTGSVDQVFKGGEVLSQAWVDLGSGYVAQGKPSVMTIPDGKTIRVVVKQDPTHSGSYVIKAADCPGGKLPNKVKVKIYWKNNTSLEVTSAARYRSLIATLVPTKE